jgi:hypothetical protein
MAHGDARGGGGKGIRNWRMEGVASTVHPTSEHGVSSIILLLKCDGTRAENRFRLSAKQTSPFKSAGVSVQSTTGRRAGHISLQGLYCSWKPASCSHVTLTGYPTPFSCFPSTSSPVRHRVPSHFKRSLLPLIRTPRLPVVD